MIIFEWKYNPLKTKMGFMAGTGTSGGGDGNSGNGGESGGGGSDSGSSSTSSTSSTNSSNNSSQSTLGTNGYTPGGLNQTTDSKGNVTGGYADSKGGKYGQASYDNSPDAASSQYSYANRGPMSWNQSVATDISEAGRKGGQEGFENAIQSAIKAYGDDAVNQAMWSGVTDGLFNSNYAPGPFTDLGHTLFDGTKGLLKGQNPATGIIAGQFGMNQDHNNAVNAAEAQARAAATAVANAKNDSANKGLTSKTNEVTNPGPTVNNPGPTNTTNDSIGSVLGHNDYTPGTPSDNTSSGNKGIVGVTSGSSNNNSSVDNGSLASGGSGSLSGPTRNTDSIGFSKYNKDEANYDQDDWNRGMETQSSGLVSDEMCKHFAKRAFADGPAFKKSRTIIIDRLR